MKQKKVATKKQRPITPILQKPIEKLAEIVNGKINSFGDGSGSWVRLDTREVGVDFVFDGKGEVLEKILLSEKKYHEVVQENIKHKIDIKR